jgi:hypothetical protein
MPQDEVEPPEPADLSVAWQAAWSEARLALRVEVTDDRHLQAQPDAAVWKEDCLQLFLTPRRWCFGYPEHSWYFLMGGLRNEDLHLAVAHREGSTVTVFRKAPELQSDAVPSGLVRARSRRLRSSTVYELSLDWRLLPGFIPATERSFGITILVSDHDGGAVQTAEYGGGVLPRRRPSEFAALRLVD